MCFGRIHPKRHSANKRHCTIEVIVKKMATSLLNLYSITINENFMKEPYTLTMTEAAKMLKEGTLTSVELTKACLDQIKKQEPEIHAFITVTEDLAISQAQAADKRIKTEKNVTPLTGIPYSMKDVYNVKNVLTTAGSNMLRDYISPYSATVYKKLNDAGAVLLGKTNCDPFGFGASTEHSAFGPTKNPHDPTRVPGGSSGGSGAAVVYGGGLFSIAEDTGGSIRCPAACCGVVGLKPTYGRVSRSGAIALASSFDSMGPIAKTCEDTALIMECIAGKDPKDATSSSRDVPSYSMHINDTIKGKTIGIPHEYFGEGLDPQISTALQEAQKSFESLGCTLKPVSLPSTEFAIPTYYIIGTSEASSNLARYDGIRYGYKKEAADWSDYMTNVRTAGFSNPEELRRIMLGTYTLSAGYADKYYKKAQGVRALLRRDFERVFNDIDVILTPTMPVLPFKLGEKLDDPLQLWLIDAYTAAINPSGLPALSTPVHKKNSLPIGMQLIAPHFREALLLNFGHVFEKSWNMNQ